MEYTTNCDVIGGVYLVAMQKSCAQCQASFEVTDGDLAYFEKISPVFNGKKELIPPPTLCPDCRKQRRMLFRNLRNLYRRKCDLTGEPILSGYAPDSILTVHRNTEWWGDAKSGLDYGREVDFSRPFFDQFKDVYREAPVVHIYTPQCENCDYINGAGKCKNCYLCFNIDYCEDCYYLADSSYNKDCIDCLGITNCELCYECIQSNNCYDLSYSYQCTNCRESALLYDCKKCSNCIACCNLIEKEYYIFNTPVSPEEFKQQKQELLAPEKLQETIRKAHEFQVQFPKKHYFGHSNEHSSGDNIIHTKNAINCFDGKEMEDCKHCHYTFDIHHCMDHTIFGDHSEWIYNCIATGTNCAHNSFCMFCWNGSHDNLYCHLIHACEHCFGCSGLKHQKYCILNKQYSEEEYSTLVPKIIEQMKQNGEWGEFFPQDMTPFAYNETVAHEYYPLTKEEACTQEYRWRENLGEIPDVEKIIPAEKLPLSIDDIPDDVLNWAIECEATQRPFHIIKQELAFYRKHKIPLPHFHPDERHWKRISRRNPRRLWQRECGKCGKEMQTSYAPERPEIVYCEECYLKEVY
jgi:hypothetical protein